MRFITLFVWCLFLMIPFGAILDAAEKMTVELNGTAVLPTYGTKAGVWFFHLQGQTPQLLLLGHPTTGTDKSPNYRIVAALGKGEKMTLVLPETIPFDAVQCGGELSQKSGTPPKFTWLPRTSSDGKKQATLTILADETDMVITLNRFVRKQGDREIPISLDPERRLVDDKPIAVSPDFHPALAQPLIEWDWRMWDGINTPLESRTYRQALEKRLPQGKALLADGEETADEKKHNALKAQWSELEKRFAALSANAKSPEKDWEQLWLDMHRVKRDILLSVSLFVREPFLFVKHAPSVMSHQLTQVYGYAARPGGGLFILEEPGRSMKTKCISTSMPVGNIMTPEVSFDGQKIWFAFCEAKITPHKWRDPETMSRRYHLWTINANGSDAKQITNGDYDDFSPLCLPDGDMIFISTRRGGFHRCGGGPCYVYTLCRMKNDGQNPRLISFHETNEWDPSLMNDGRIVYTRWDYVDRDAVHYQNLWSTRQDGTDVRAFYGNNTFNPCGIWETRAIPDSNKVMAIAGPHHGMSAGCVIMIDNTQGVDGSAPVTRVTPEVLYPEGEVPLPKVPMLPTLSQFDTEHQKFWKASMPAERKTLADSEEARRWPVHCFKSPWPFSEKYFMASYSFDTLTGEAGPNIPNQFGIYFCDAFGNRELIYRDLNISSLWARPLVSRPVPTPYQSTLPARETAPKTGRYFIQNIYESAPGKITDKVRSLRIVEVMIKTTPNADQPPVGKAFAAPGKKVLGTVPVEKDGSAAFEIPAETPILFQALDEKGRMIQGMRSLVYLQPGETASCTGCHEDRMSTVPSAVTIASRKKEPDRLKPGPEGSNPFSYRKLIQPILDRSCVQCHRAEKAEGKVILTGELQDRFTRSYNELSKYVYITYWGAPNRNDEPYSMPNRYGSRVSPLTKILEGKDGKGHYGCKLSEDDWNRFNTWMDVNGLFRGSTDMP